MQVLSLAASVPTRLDCPVREFRERLERRAVRPEPSARVPSYSHSRIAPTTASPEASCQAESCQRSENYLSDQSEQREMSAQLSGERHNVIRRRGSRGAFFRWV